MNSAADLKRYNNDQAFDQAKNKIMKALQNDPLGLSISQLMTTCKLSIKTVKAVVSGTEFQNEDGVFFLKDQGKYNPELATKPQEKVTTFIEKITTEPEKVTISDESVTTEPEKITTLVKPGTILDESETIRRDVCKIVIELLEKSKTGLTAEEIKSQLRLNDKQFTNARYRITKQRPLYKTRSANGLVYSLVPNESAAAAPSIVPDLPVVQHSEPELPTEVPTITALPTAVDLLKAQISTVVTKKNQLSLTVDQLSVLLGDIFGMNDVQFWTDHGKLTGVYLSSEVTAEEV